MVRWLLALAALVDGAFGAGLLVAPGPLLAIYGLSVDRDGTFLARFLGATLVGFAVLSWLARAWQGRQLRQYLGTCTATTTLGFVVSLVFELQPGAPVMAWAFVLLTGAFAAAFAYATYRAG